MCEHPFRTESKFNGEVICDTCLSSIYKGFGGSGNFADKNIFLLDCLKCNKKTNHERAPNNSFMCLDCSNVKERLINSFFNKKCENCDKNGRVLNNGHIFCTPCISLMGESQKEI
jgi:hypothetical protein